MPLRWRRTSNRSSPLDRAEIQQQVDKIVASRSFAGKSQLIKLLKILLDHLDSSTLKPDRVIREVWPDEIKTKTSADVATEMNRLRKALDSYYAAEGASDAIVITLPNRAVPASGVREKRWMVAQPRVPAQEVPEEEVPPTEAAPAQLAPARDEVPQPASRTGRRLWLMNLGIAAALLVVAGLFLAGLITRDRRPYAARIEGSTLIISNQKGEELWRKSFSDGFWPQYYQQGVAQRVWFGDLKGDSQYEVLFAYHPASNPLSHSSTLFCFSGRGKELWRWSLKRPLPGLEGDPPTYEIKGFGVLPRMLGKPSQIVTLSIHNPWMPSQIALLGSDGRLVSEYWHSGHLDYLTLGDLDGDGQREIIATGISNGYHQATMIVLDSDQVNGASIEKARPEIQIHGMGTPHERARLLFPRSDLNFAKAPYNEGMGVTFENGEIRFWTKECSQGDGIWYELDNHFRLLHVEAGDLFRSVHDEYYRKEKKPHLFNPEELEQFEKVRCLAGCPGDYVAVDIH